MKTVRRRLGFYIMRLGGWVAGVKITSIKADRGPRDD